METLLGFKLDFWDYATFVVLLVCVITGLFFLVWLGGHAPNRHPQLLVAELALPNPVLMKLKVQ